MLTISKPLSAGQAQSYHAEEFGNARENYYTEGEQIRGRYQTLPRDTTVPDLRSEVWRWSACVGLLEEVPLLACWLSLDFLVLTLLLFIGHECLSRSSVPRRLACSCRGRRNLRLFLRWLLCRALDVLRLFAFKLDVRETHPRHEISALEITVHLFKAADLACHNERPDLAFEVIALRFARLWELLICAALAYPLNLLFSYGVANPFRCVRLARAQKDFR